MDAKKKCLYLGMSSKKFEMKVNKNFLVRLSESLPCRAAGCRWWGAVLQRPEPRPLPLLPAVLHVHITTRARDRLRSRDNAPPAAFSLSLQRLATCQTHWDRRAARDRAKRAFYYTSTHQALSMRSCKLILIIHYSTSELPVHAVFSQAAGGEPLGVGSVPSLLSCNLGVILKLLDDVPHTARTDCTRR